MARTSYTQEFKARVVLEVLREESEKIFAVSYFADSLFDFVFLWLVVLFSPGYAVNFKFAVGLFLN